MTTRAESLPPTREKHDTLTSELISVDHKTIGVRYMLTGFLFFCLAGIEALFIRAQLTTAKNTLLSPDVYNQFFTMHGTTMVFFFAAPVLFGFGSYLVPLMIGAKNLAFSRLNAFGYWVFLFSGLFIYSGFLFGMVPDGGLFSLSQLVGPTVSSRFSLDFWSLGLIFLSISMFTGALNFIFTVFKMRAPGIFLNRMPLFAWAILATSFVMIVSILLLASANIMLMLDSRFGMKLLQGSSGSHPLQWLYLFWANGHPEIYIILLPSIGIVGELIGAFSRRPILGYRLQVFSIVAAAMMGFVLSLVSTATQAPTILLNITSLMIFIPGSILIATWLTSLLTGRPVWKTPLLWIGGFIFMIVLGGITGVLFLATPFGRQLSSTYFVVANLHYLLVGGAVFPIFAGVYYWFPRIFGRMLSDRWGKISFWLFFIGVNITFFPMYFLGLMGMPRRVYTYQPGMGWDLPNILATIGALMIIESVLIFIVNIVTSLTRGEVPGDNPWDSNSLEWTAGSAPDPLIASSLSSPAKSILPFWLAVSVLLSFVGVLLSLYWLAGIGALLAVILIAVWAASGHLKRNRLSNDERLNE